MSLIFSISRSSLEIVRPIAAIPRIRRFSSVAANGCPRVEGACLQCPVIEGIDQGTMNNAEDQEKVNNTNQ